MRLWVCYHNNSKLCPSIFTKLGLYSVGKDSDHLQLIKFWPSHPLGKGVSDGAKIFGSALLQPARSVWVSLSAFFFALGLYEDRCVVIAHQHAMHGVYDIVLAVTVHPVR